MTPITLVMPYYRNTGMLKRHYELWEKMDDLLREHVHVVIVDDGSPEGAAYVPPASLHFMPIQIYRIKQDVRWNQDAARNIGVAHAETSWVLLTDIDHMVGLKTWRFLVTQLELKDNGMVYRFSRVSEPDFLPYKPHPNSWLMTKKLFDAAGGYDERYAGFYGTDGDFRDRVVPLAKEVVMLKEPLIRVPRCVTPDASTTTYLRKQPEDADGLRKVGAEIKRLKEAKKYKPLNRSFPYHRLYP